jgi:hypothetical protein
MTPIESDVLDVCETAFALCSGFVSRGGRPPASWMLITALDDGLGLLRHAADVDRCTGSYCPDNRTC